MKQADMQLDIRMSDGVTIAAPASLRSITTYVLLEQETWFEKEPAFLRRWLRPGMVAIDIGANLGVYSLPMARLVGPSGRVFAFEPGSEARRHLQRSREINGASHLHISPLALSDGKRSGRLVFGQSSELNTLNAAGEGEAVDISSLDDEARGWPAPDFVKIDAEGEEERILAGGQEFFARHSPLVMFEVSASDKMRLRHLFEAMGYRVFRQLVRPALLVPVPPVLDDYELNLFAAKPDRVRLLMEQGLLVEAFPEDVLRTARAAYRKNPAPERLEALARAAWESGMRKECVQTLRQAQQPLTGPMLELLEKARSFSSIFAPALLAWLQPSSSAEMHRRHFLTETIAGRSPSIPAKLCEEAADHLNAALWRSLDPAALVGR